jgi:opacity protein-like surface antigen
VDYFTWRQKQKMKRLFILLALAVTFSFGATSYAQEATFNEKSDVYIGYQFVRVNPNVREANFRFDRNTDTHGVNTSLAYYPDNKSVGFTGELAANFSGGRFDSSLVTAQAGLTIKDRQGDFNPFIRGLVGAARSRAANEQVNPSTFFDRSDVGLAFTVGTGLDVKASDKVSLRLVQLDYLQTRIYGQPVHNVRIGAGIVF